MRNVLFTSIVLLASASAASATVYTTTLSSLNQVPPQESVATGSATITLVGDILRAKVIYNNLAGAASFGHIHCCASAKDDAPVAVPFADFPGGVTGVYRHVFNLLDAAVYTPDFLAASGGTALDARNVLANNLDLGLAYVNIHDAPAYPAGEIRGQLAVSTAAVPEPAMLSLLGLGALALGVGRRRA